VPIFADRWDAWATVDGRAMDGECASDVERAVIVVTERPVRSRRESAFREVGTRVNTALLVGSVLEPVDQLAGEFGGRMDEWEEYTVPRTLAPTVSAGNGGEQSR
jgi:hypothetical protein